jgi:hypothetical protein
MALTVKGHFFNKAHANRHIFSEIDQRQYIIGNVAAIHYYGVYLSPPCHALAIHPAYASRLQIHRAG